MNTNWLAEHIDIFYSMSEKVSKSKNQTNNLKLQHSKNTVGGHLCWLSGQQLQV